MADTRGYILASKLFGSGILAQAFGFLATAYAAIRTNPEDFALFAAVMAATALLGSFNSLAAESRVPVVPQPRAEAVNRAGFTAVSALSVACAVVGLVATVSGQVWGQVALLTAWCSFMLGLQHLLVGIVLRSQRQELLARNRLVQGISNALLIVGLLAAGVPGFLALCFSWGLSLTISDLVLLPRIHGWAVGFRPARWADVRSLLSEVRLQPISNVLSDGVAQIPLLVLPALGTPLVSGAWALANRFLTPVINMAQITLQPIYYGRAAALLRDGDGQQFLAHQKIWSRRLAVAALPVVPLCYLCLVWLIPLFGPQWAVSSLVLLPACILFPMGLSWLPISQTLILSGHLRTQFYWTVGQFVLAIVPFALASFHLLSAENALLWWSLASSGAMLLHRWLQRLAPVDRS